MLQTSLISDNLKTKKQLVSDPSWHLRKFPYSIHLEIHQVALCFYFDNEDVVRELYDSYPLAWFGQGRADEIPVYWHNTRDLGFKDEEWEAESSYDCYVERNNGFESVVQRDFAAKYDGKSCTLFCPYSVQDGFYNFLRWLLPLKFLGQNKLLLHSSCVVDSHKNAYFCLGASGAGKTTIASLRPRKKILGDDMNVVKIENGQCWAQAGALGQALLNPAEYSNWYPVKAFFWLKKSATQDMKQMSKASQVKCLSTSVANVFWDNLSEEQALVIFKYINEILKINQMYELSFPIQHDIWDFVFQAFKEDK